jgi:hypothetical protein
MRVQVPWQVLVTVLLIYGVVYAVLTAAAAICIWFAWPFTSVLLLFGSFAILSFLAPIALSWTRSAYKVLIPLHVLHQLFTVLIYAGHYKSAGLGASSGARSHTFADAFYFSLATWSTLGASDLAVPRDIRLLPPLEALTCILFLPVFASVLWQMLQEMTAPPEQAYLDRRRK